jgi:hypothetical protein
MGKVVIRLTRAVPVQLVQAVGLLDFALVVDIGFLRYEKHGA